MSNGHVRRTKSPNRTGGTSRRLWFLSLTLPVIAITPAIWSTVVPEQPGNLQTVIREAGFDPLDPPSRLRGPGALYVVEDGAYRKVCEPDPALLSGKMHQSPTQSHVLERLQGGGFSVKGGLLKTLNASLGGSRVTSIEYGLRDVAISEITLADLADIQGDLLRQKSCDAEVTRLLQEKHMVCAGYAALSATAFYKVHVDAKFHSNADGRAPIITAAQQAIQEHTQGQVNVKGRDELTGENLFYGIQLAKRCLTLDTATEPSILQPPSAPAGRSTGT